MPFTAPPEYPYSDDSSPGANDGDIVYANIVNVIMEYLEDDLPTDILDAAGVSASDDNPEDLGTPAPGVSVDFSRSDHVHQMPSAADVGAATSADISAAITAHEGDTDPHGDRAYADSLFAQLNDADYQGTIDCTSNPNYPAADADHSYRVVGAGKIGGASGVDVEVGDLAICLSNGTPSGDQATVGANWTIVQNNLNGAVIGPSSSIDERIAIFEGTSGRLIKQSSYTFADFLTTDELTDHLNDTTDAHDASAISVDASGFNGNLTTSDDTVQEVAQKLDDLSFATPASVYTITANTVTDNYTLVLADAGKVVEMNAATAKQITVPTNASVAYDVGTVIELYQMGAGTVTIAGDTGVTVRNAGTLSAQYATASLRKRATNEWVLSGELI